MSTLSVVQKWATAQHVAHHVTLQYSTDNGRFRLLLWDRERATEPFAECSFTADELADMLDRDAERRR